MTARPLPRSLLTEEPSLSDAVAGDPITHWDTLLDEVAHVLRHPSEAGFAPRLEVLVEAIQAALAQDADAGIFAMLHGEDAAGYAVTHALRTALVATLVAERCGWSPSARRTLVRAGLTMNIAMLDLQDTLVTQTTPPTARQRTEIASHARRGRAMLEAAGITDPDWLDTVAHHHVTPGGHALPRQRRDLCPLACMIHYADVYLARLSPRATRAALAVNVAAREFHVSAGGADNPFVTAILEAMGIFPPGTFVKLRNGETAIVLHRGPAPDAPIVRSVMRKDASPLPQLVARDTTQPEFKVVAALPRGQVMLRLNRQMLFGHPSV